MRLANIPAEMQAFDQWVVWRLEYKQGDTLRLLKPTKIPYSLDGNKASVSDPSTWASFEAVVGASLHSIEPCDPDAPTSETGFSGVGFVFTKADPFVGVDLDCSGGDAVIDARQKDIFTNLNSYSERSPSGMGLHIICKGMLPGAGRKRGFVEVYDTGRFFTMTGDVFHNVPVMQREAELATLYDEMGGPVVQYQAIPEADEKQTDAEILTMARDAANGEKFSALYDGAWQNYFGPNHGHPGEGRSEADIALVNIIAFYSRNRNQIERMFMASQLGDRYKVGNMRHNQRKLGYMIEKSFDNMPPPIDTEGLKIQFEIAQAERAREEGGASGKPSGKPDAPGGAAIEGATVAEPSSRSPVASTERPFPRGLVGEIAQFIYDAAPRPVREIALAGAIGFVAGLTGRAYNISGSGLSQYIILVADTGRGKEAIASGISKLTKVVAKTSPTITDYVGPEQIASSQALSKWLGRAPCVFSIVGEFGLKLRQLADERAPPHLVLLKADLLSLYHKNGHNDVWGASAYAKREDCAAAVNSPAFTLIGESTPQKFFENISEEVVTDGLVPRFTIFSYEGDQVPLNKNREKLQPSIELIERLGSLVAQCSSITSLQSVQNIAMTPEAQKIMDDFEKLQRDGVNNRDPLTGAKLPTRPSQAVTELWNRIHIKALRLAGVLAVGVNHLFPCVDAEQATWATNEIYWQTKGLIDRFKRGDIGGGAVNAVANEDRQTSVMVHRICQFVTGKAKTGQYKDMAEMMDAKVIPYNWLNQTLRIYPDFKNDRRGASEAITKIYRQLLDSGDIVELPKDQMQKKYGRAMRAFQIVNADRFLDAA